MFVKFPLRQHWRPNNRNGVSLRVKKGVFDSPTDRVVLLDAHRFATEFRPPDIGKITTTRIDALHRLISKGLVEWLGLRDWRYRLTDAGRLLAANELAGIKQPSAPQIRRPPALRDV